MTMRLIACVLIGSVMGTEGARAEMAAARQAAAVQGTAVQTLAAAPAVPATINLPAGTKIPLNLVTQIMSKSSKPGDTVRAVVAFPVTAGSQLAIPAGTYVEGQLVSTTAAKAAKKTTRYGASAPASSGLQIHFTKLVYANGYTVPLDAQNVAGVKTDAAGVEVASADEGALQMPVAREHGPDGGAAFLEGQVGYPTLPPLPQNPGPNPVAISLGVVGAFALLVVGGVLLAKHSNKGTDAVLYDAGWQFSMSLASALTLDKAQVMDAAKMGPVTP